MIKVSTQVEIERLIPLLNRQRTRIGRMHDPGAVHQNARQVSRLVDFCEELLYCRRISQIRTAQVGRNAQLPDMLSRRLSFIF